MPRTRYIRPPIAIFTILACVLVPALLPASAAAQRRSGRWQQNGRPSLHAPYAHSGSHRHHQAWGLQVRFPKWHIGATSADWRGDGCRPSERCGRSACRTCRPPALACRPGARCQERACSTCHPGHHHDRYSYADRLDHGWNALLGCDYKDALSIFRCLIDEDPRDAEARIGLAIAHGLRGKHSSAADAMRRAVLRDPHALMHGTWDRAQRSKVRDVLRDLESHAHGIHGHPDDWFMIAALEAMLGHDTAAIKAIHRAIASGDCSSAASELERSLEAAHRGRGRHGHGHRARR